MGALSGHINENLGKVPREKAPGSDWCARASPSLSASPFPQQHAERLGPCLVAWSPRGCSEEPLCHLLTGPLTEKRQLLSRERLSPARLPRVTVEGDLGEAAGAKEPSLRCGWWGGGGGNPRALVLGAARACLWSEGLGELQNHCDTCPGNLPSPCGAVSRKQVLAGVALVPPLPACSPVGTCLQTLTAAGYG